MSRNNRSRVTLAMMLAAAIEHERPSPFTMPSCGHGNPLTGKPSMRQWSGTTPNPSTARRIAKWVARKMLNMSTSAADASATAHRTSGSSVRA